MIKMLPPSLRDEVLSNTFGETLEHITFFREMNDIDFLWKVLPLLKRFKVEKGEVVFWTGDSANDVFFLVRGSVLLYTAKGNPFIKYKEGDTLGDSDALLNLPRDSKCVALTHLRIMIMCMTPSLLNILKREEKRIVEMILIARKKRDYHKRLMQEADRRAEKEQMIQTLINNKVNLYKYIAGNEKEL
jgi:CRP-like cAMP-binding protein